MAKSAGTGQSAIVRNMKKQTSKQTNKQKRKQKRNKTKTNGVIFLFCLFFIFLFIVQFLDFCQL